MQFRISKVVEKIKDNNGYVIYGTGAFATDLFNKLAGRNLNPLYFVESKKKSDYFGENIPVFNLEDKKNQLKKGDVLVIVAVNRATGKEIVKLLEENDVFNYIEIADYDYSLYEYSNICYEMKENEFKALMADYEYDTQGHRENSLVNKYDIVFALGDLQPRALKMLKALTAIGKKCKIIAGPSEGVEQTFIKELDSLGLSCTWVSTVVEWMYQVYSTDAEIIHLLTCRAHSRWDRLFISNKKFFCPIVYDEYDIINCCHIEFDGQRELFDNERYCLENADGICNRGYEIELLINSGIRIDSPYIQFHDYCNNEQYECDDKYDELALCYVGGLQLDGEYENCFKRWLFELADKCECCNAKLHVYTQRYNEDTHKDYIEKAKKCEAFEVYKGVPFDKLAETISQYDYGIFPYTKEVYEWDTINHYTNNKLVYCTTNKYFDYIDAGLPIISVMSKKLLEYLSGFGIVVNWGTDEYDFEWLKENRSRLKENTIEAHKKLRISEHINELVEFYSWVIKYKNGC